MTDAFEQDQVDFPGMSSGRKFFLSKVLHKPFMEVKEEEGTEAVATTATIMMFLCQRFTTGFCADNLFLFFIQHSKTKSIVFCGWFSSP